jgi:hypothetical protein
MNTGSLWDNYQMIQQSVVNTMDPEELYRYKKMSELLIKKTMKEPDDPHVAKMESATQVRLMLRDGLDPDDLEEDEREIYVDVYGLKSLENYKKDVDRFGDSSVRPEQRKDQRVPNGNERVAKTRKRTDKRNQKLSKRTKPTGD